MAHQIMASWLAGKVSYYPEAFGYPELWLFGVVRGVRCRVGRDNPALLQWS